jgi:hypothetical protein
VRRSHLAAVIFVFWIEPDPGDSAPHRSQLDQLLERRDSIYDNLRDLKFENRAGKYAEQDYEQMRDSLENEAAQVLLEIENVTGNQAPFRAAIRPRTLVPSGQASACPGLAFASIPKPHRLKPVRLGPNSAREAGEIWEPKT